MNIGANYKDGSCEFVVWAPQREIVSLHIGSPKESLVGMTRDHFGYWGAQLQDVAPGTRYFYRLDGSIDRPDPASHFQPEGVHGPSVVVDQGEFNWTDAGWQTPSLADTIVYELHTGTFTDEGTFKAIIPRIDDLKQLGINAIEIMPAAQFPGARNWGYDGVYPFAVQNSYGGPAGLKKLVDACHAKGTAVILDVVYNHLGPEGNYFCDFGPYFSDKYRLPWGRPINFDGAYSDGVRNYYIENALYWFRDFHFDGLRLDAVHAIFDTSATPFLMEVAQRVAEFSTNDGRKRYLIAESDLNDARVIRPIEFGGYGHDAQWCDDFHHSLRTLLTGQRDGYYVDFGKPEQFAKSLHQGYVYDWEYSEYRKRHHGNSPIDRHADQFVVFCQNHDQIGNQMLGTRLSKQVSYERLKLAAGAVLLSPYIPMLFMGEEYGETAPFLFFVNHSDEKLIEAVREGRKEEFRAFNWEEEPPDPQSEETFLQSKLQWELRNTGSHKVLLDYYRRLIELRRELPALKVPDNRSLDISLIADGSVIAMRRWRDESSVLCLMNFVESEVKFHPPVWEGTWRKLLDSAGELWNGPGSSIPDEIEPGRQLVMNPTSLALFEFKDGRNKRIE